MTWGGADVIIIEIEHTVSVICLNCPETMPRNLWKNCLPWDRSLVPKNGWKGKVLVPQSCPTLYDPMDCSPPGSSVQGILQARILEWIAIPFSRGSSQPRDWTEVSCISGRFLYHLSHQGSSKRVGTFTNMETRSNKAIVRARKCNQVQFTDRWLLIWVIPHISGSKE